MTLTVGQEVIVHWHGVYRLAVVIKDLGREVWVRLV